MSEVAEIVIPQLIVGLGNPGMKYDRTRHNVGFDAIDSLARRWQIPMAEQKKFQGIFGEGIAPNRSKIRLLKPQTFMNLSGQSVRAVIDWYKIPPTEVLVIYDDMDLPLGKIRMRLSGSAGGHNGMKSLISHLGGQKFPRMRFGIGKQSDDKDTISHVLGKFTPTETNTVADVISLIDRAIESSLEHGVEKSMSLYNNQSIGPINDE